MGDESGRLRIVLVSPKYSGNIGSVARVMKNFGLTDLALVDPRADPLSEESLSLASGAEDLLKAVDYYPTLTAALDTSVTVIGTTSLRERVFKHPVFTLDQTIAMLPENLPDPRSLVLGPEDRGLSIRELELCTHVMTIPTEEAFPTINLAQSAAICIYRFMTSDLKTRSPENRSSTHKEREDTLEHLARALLSVGFLDPVNPERIMRDLRSVFARAKVDSRELKILRGISRKLIRLSRYLPEQKDLSGN